MANYMELDEREEQAADVVYDALKEYLGEDDVELFGNTPTSLRISLTMGSFIVTVEEE